MQYKDKIIAIFFSDPHLSLTAPPLRSEEPDWFAAMERPFNEIKAIQKIHRCPVFCCGDVFDRWNSPPELINWTFKTLPLIYSTPGQHDLPYHDYMQIKRSAFWTLTQTRKIGLPLRSDYINFEVDHFPFGTEIKPNTCKCPKWHIAIIHQYNCITTADYMKPSQRSIPSSEYVGKHRKEFEGYDYVFSGDNHIPFIKSINTRTKFINCGSIIRRKSTDLYWHPSIWLLHADGVVQRYKLDVSKDRYLDSEDTIKKEQQNDSIDIKEVIKKLGQLGQDALDVRDAFKRAFAEETQQRKDILTRAMGE